MISIDLKYIHIHISGDTARGARGRFGAQICSEIHGGYHRKIPRFCSQSFHNVILNLKMIEGIPLLFSLL